jgi:U2-associated protein SR140
MIRQQKSQRRRMMERKDYLTGRQLERAKFGRASGGAEDGGLRMTDTEMTQFNLLAREKLCASRDCICKAMAFCFEKSGVATQISEMLKELLLDDAPGVSVDTRTARLYLLSDVLYNSQQPGVRNAFLYRDAIERMAPEVFASLGKHGDSGKVGRMTLLKLKAAVRSVLSAWTNWSVYNPAFIDKLEARFEGRELPAPAEDVKEEDELQKQKSPQSASEVPKDTMGNSAGEEPQGNWTEVSEDLHETAPWEEKRVTTLAQRTETQKATSVNHTTERDESVHAKSDMDGDLLEEEDIDGESLGDEDNVVHGPDDQKSHQDKLAEKSPSDEDIDGEALDGEPFDE